MSAHRLARLLPRPPGVPVAALVAALTVLACGAARAQGVDPPAPPHLRGPVEPPGSAGAGPAAAVTGHGRCQRGGGC